MSQEIHFTMKREKQSNQQQGYYVKIVEFPAET